MTDGASEPDQPATAAGMVFDPESGLRSFFAYDIPQARVEQWLAGKLQAINVTQGDNKDQSI